MIEEEPKSEHMWKNNDNDKSQVKEGGRGSDGFFQMLIARYFTSNNFLLS